MLLCALLCALSGATAAIKREEMSALAPGEDPSTCVAIAGTGVTEKWCSNNCANVPPNCPASLCTCGEAAPEAAAPEAAAPEFRAAVASPSPQPVAAVVPIGDDFAAAPQNGKDSLHPDAVQDRTNGTELKKHNSNSPTMNKSSGPAAKAANATGKANAATAAKGATATAAKGNAASAAKGTAAKADEKKAGATTKAVVKPGSATKAGCKTDPCQAHCPFNEKCAKQMKEKNPKLSDEKKASEEKKAGEAKKAAPAKPDEKKPAKVGCDKDPCQDFCPSNSGCQKKATSKVAPAPAKPAEKKPEPKKQEPKKQDDKKAPR